MATDSTTLWPTNSGPPNSRLPNSRPPNGGPCPGLVTLHGLTEPRGPGRRRSRQPAMSRHQQSTYPFPAVYRAVHQHPRYSAPSLYVQPQVAVWGSVLTSIVHQVKTLRWPIYGTCMIIKISDAAPNLTKVNIVE